jgi:hypothetical protein
MGIIATVSSMSDEESEESSSFGGTGMLKDRESMREPCMRNASSV